MKIYFNQCYTKRPFLKEIDRDIFAPTFCGPEGLFDIILLHGEIPKPRISPEQRQAVYHNHLASLDLSGTFFEDSLSE